MAEKRDEDGDAAFDAIVLDAVRYHRYCGVTLEGMKEFVGARHKGSTTDKAMAAALGRLESAEQVVRVGTRWLLHRSVFRHAKGAARTPEFEFADTWILMSVLSAGKDEPCTLDRIIAAADFISRAIPMLDELHGALNRLLAAKLITTRGGAYAPTDKAVELLQKVMANCKAGVWEHMDGMGRILQCPCCGVQLQRVTWRINLTEDDVAAAHKMYLATWAARRKRKRTKR